MTTLGFKLLSGGYNSQGQGGKIFLDKSVGRFSSQPILFLQLSKSKEICDHSSFHFFILSLEKLLCGKDSPLMSFEADSHLFILLSIFLTQSCIPFLDFIQQLFPVFVKFHSLLLSCFLPASPAHQPGWKPWVCSLQGSQLH